MKKHEIKNMKSESIIFVIVVLFIAFIIFLALYLNTYQELQDASYEEGRIYSSENGNSVAVSEDWLVFENHMDLLSFINKSKDTVSTDYSQKSKCIKDYFYTFNDSGYVDGTYGIKNKLIKLLYIDDPVKASNCDYFIVGTLDKGKKELFYVVDPSSIKKSPSK